MSPVATLTNYRPLDASATGPAFVLRVRPRHAGTRYWLRDARELFGTLPREAASRAFDHLLPRGVRARAWSAVEGRGAPVGWALAYAITRGLRNAVWLVWR